MSAIPLNILGKNLTNLVPAPRTIPLNLHGVAPAPAPALPPIAHGVPFTSGQTGPVPIGQTTAATSANGRALTIGLVAGALGIGALALLG